MCIACGTQCSKADECYSGLERHVRDVPGFIEAFSRRMLSVLSNGYISSCLSEDWHKQMCATPETQAAHDLLALASDRRLLRRAILNFSLDQPELASWFRRGKSPQISIPALVLIV